MKIPQISYVEITKENFFREAIKLAIVDKPKFSIHEIALLKGTMDTSMPCLICSVETRTGGYVYDVIRVRTFDGQFERHSAVAEKSLEKLEEK